MEIIRTVNELRARLAREGEVACVPTMGNIHDGHLSLVRLATERAPFVVTTIFVNRLQFGQHEDFDKYPRTFEDDCQKLEAAGNHLVFHPDEGQMYPSPQAFLVEQEANATILTHYHQQNQFQVVVGGDGTLGRHAVAPLLVHYAGAFTGYGPIVSGAQGLQYLTFRANNDPGAQFLPLSGLADRVDELPRDTQFLVICHSGGRSAKATALLTAQGFDAVNVLGGMTAWRAAEGPVTVGS